MSPKRLLTSSIEALQDVYWGRDFSTAAVKGASNRVSE